MVELVAGDAPVGREIYQDGLVPLEGRGEPLLGEGLPFDAGHGRRAPEDASRGEEEERRDREPHNARDPLQARESRRPDRRSVEPAEEDTGDERRRDVSERRYPVAQQMPCEIEAHRDQYESEYLPHPDHPVAAPGELRDAPGDGAEDEQRCAEPPGEGEEHEKAEEGFPLLAYVGEEPQHEGADAGRRYDADGEPHENGPQVAPLRRAGPAREKRR